MFFSIQNLELRLIHEFGGYVNLEDKKREREREKEVKQRAYKRMANLRKEKKGYHMDKYKI